MPEIEFEGKNTEEALEKASAQLHIPKDEIKFEILSTGSSGIFGLGGKKAKIKVKVEEKISTKKEDLVHEGESRPGAFIRAVEPPAFDKKSDEPENPSSLPREPRTRDKSRSSFAQGKRERSRPRPQGPPRQERTGSVSQVPASQESSRSFSKGRPKGRSNSAFPQNKVISSENAPLSSTAAAPGETTYDGPEDEIMTRARTSLEGIIQRMGLEAKVISRKIGDRLILFVDGDESGLLIGKKGATLDALQFLVNKIINRSSEDKFRVVVDTEDYRNRRHQSLIDLARKMADKAIRTRRAVIINQLSAHDRRVIHLALQDLPGLKTKSRGDGPLKNIIIIPGNFQHDDLKDQDITDEAEDFNDLQVHQEL